MLLLLEVLFAHILVQPRTPTQFGLSSHNIEKMLMVSVVRGFYNFAPHATLPALNEIYSLRERRCVPWVTILSDTVLFNVRENISLRECA